MSKNNNLNISTINIFIRKKKDIYATLSSVYYLPSITSKACSKQWLKELSKEDCTYFKIRNEEIRPVFIEIHRYDAFSLLQYLENLLKNKKLPSTGLTATTLPNIEWLHTVILAMEPEDRLKLKQPPFRE